MGKATVDEIIDRFGLEPHPEGGYFSESYRSTEVVLRTSLPVRFGGDRCFSTAIYYLLTGGDKSRFHRIASDEIWHHYMGDPLVIVEITKEGEVVETVLGNDLSAGQVPQYVVAAGRCFGARSDGDGFAFVGCTVAPGFDFGDFEMADRDELLARYPKAGDTIMSMT
jgi:uncharacterized protein